LLKRTVSGIIVLILLFIGIFASAFNIQPVKSEWTGTVYIRADGSIDPPTAPIQRDGNLYTLTDNIFSDADGIVIERSGVVLDGADYILHGTPSSESNGIYMFGIEGVTIKNMVINGFRRGIYLREISNVNITNNEITNSPVGIRFSEGTKGIIFRNKITNNSISGIWLWQVSYSSIIQNNLTTSEGFSIVLSSSAHTTMTGNRMEDSFGFYVWGFSIDAYVHSIDSSNLVDEKPVYYLINQKNLTITPEEYPEIGYLGLVNCSNIIVERLNFSRKAQAVMLAFTDNSTIRENTMTNCLMGICVAGSSNNTIVENGLTGEMNLTWSEEGVGCRGILIHISSNSLIQRNRITNHFLGIGIYSSSNITLHQNTMDNNSYNLDISGSTLDEFMHLIDDTNLVDGKPVYYLLNKEDVVVNPLTYPNVGYLAFINSTNITIENLTLTKNDQGLMLVYTNHSIIANNNITKNDSGIFLQYCSNITIYNNNIVANWVGICIKEFVDNSTINGNDIKNNEFGVSLDASGGPHSVTYNRIIGNKITNNTLRGISLSHTQNTTVAGNNIAGNGEGIMLYGVVCCNNTISGNNITLNDCGIYLLYSSNNMFYHNNFIMNNNHVTSYMYETGPEIWDNGYEGNYWSDYNGTDLNGDGIGDTPYIIDENNQDNYPLIDPWNPDGRIRTFNVTLNNKTYQVSILSNSTIEDFLFNYTTEEIRINLTGPPSTTGFCNITVPKELVNGTFFAVLVDGVAVDYVYAENSTYCFFYFSYEHSTHNVTVLVTIVGDINGDRKVNMRDVGIAALAFGSQPGDSYWNPIADITGTEYLVPDGKVNMRDIGLISRHFGETYG